MGNESKYRITAVDDDGDDFTFYASGYKEAFELAYEYIGYDVEIEELVSKYVKIANLPANTTHSEGPKGDSLPSPPTP